MANLRKVSGEEAIRALEKLGFVRVRQKGSHVILKKTLSTGSIGCVIPLHNELKIGTIHSILKQARIEPEDFIEQL